MTNYKYKKERDFDYTSKLSIKPNIIIRNKQDTKQAEFIEKKKLITSKLISLLTENTEKEDTIKVNKYIYLKAAKCGINIIDHDTILKDITEIKLLVDQMFQYVSSLEDLYNTDPTKIRPKDLIFNVKSVREIADVFDIKYTDGCSREYIKQELDRYFISI